MEHTNNLASIVCSFYCVRPKWWLWKYFSPHKQTLRFCIRIYQWPSPIVYIGIVAQNTQRMTTLFLIKQERNWYFAPTALSMVHITTKGLSTMRTKALDNKAQHFHAANGIAIRLLLSLLLCVCHGQYSIHCHSQFTIQMAALFEQSVYYIYVCCVCWLRLERKYSKRVHSSELIFTCLCVCNRGIFVRLMSSVPWPMHLTITIGPIQLSA